MVLKSFLLFFILIHKNLTNTLLQYHFQVKYLILQRDRSLSTFRY